MSRFVCMHRVSQIQIFHWIHLVTCIHHGPTCCALRRILPSRNGGFELCTWRSTRCSFSSSIWDAADWIEDAHVIFYNWRPRYALYNHCMNYEHTCILVPTPLCSSRESSQRCWSRFNWERFADTLNCLHSPCNASQQKVKVNENLLLIPAVWLIWEQRVINTCRVAIALFAHFYFPLLKFLFRSEE